MSERPRVLVIGELNPYGSLPQFALYHLPERASGARLRAIMGLSVDDYKRLDKVNLCYGKWSMKEARKEVARLKAADDPRARWPKAVILLGAKVRAAFDLKTHDFYSAIPCAPTFILLPHPSGLNRVWNDPFAYVRAREVLRKHVPEIPWGSCESI